MNNEMRTIAYVFTFFSFGVLAQTRVDSTTVLDEVVVFGLSLDEYAAGTSIRSIGLDESGSLQDIGAKSSLFFKNYGNGGLSTISLRGTSASHTNVLWNGIPVNSPTLGQTDYSVFPSFLMDNISVIKGSSSSIFGSGSIGGTVVVDNSKVRRDSLLTISSGVGSFGQINAGVKAQYDISPKLKAESRLFIGRIDNDFKYELRGEEVRQPNAAIKRMGLSQRFNYQQKKFLLFSEIAYAENDREIQPTKTSASRNELFTKNLRGVISYEQYFGDATLFSSVGYAGETTIYNSSSKTDAHTFSGQFVFDLPINNWLLTRTGLTTIQSSAVSDNYSDTKQMGEFHVFSSISMKPVEQLRLSVNLRESFHDNNAVFSPSIGMDVLLGSFTLRGQVSNGYRAPTFNDRFWMPGGNPDLKAEQSKNAELGFDFDKKKLSLSATGFISKVSDWIQWVPDNGIFTPMNLREVQTYGLEFNGSFDFTLGPINASLNTGYDYILSSDVSMTGRTFSQKDKYFITIPFIGEILLDAENQLPYVPKHSGYTSIGLSKNSFLLSLTGNYTGLRYTTLTNSRQSEIDGFLLFDVVVETSQILRKSNMTFRLSLNNIFNQDYENVNNTAMPGRNFLTELIFKI